MRPFDRAPNYKFGRLVTANDAIPLVGVNATEDFGWDFQHYEIALFRVIPIQNPPASGEAFFASGGDLSSLIGTPTSNPAIEAYFYDQASKLWCKHNPAITFTAAGAGVATEIEIPNANGRRVGLAVTSGVTGGQGVVILASAYFRQELE